MPPARAALGAELHHDWTGRWADRAYAGAEVEVATRQTRRNPLDIPTGGYTLLNLSAGFVRPLAAGLATSISQSAMRPT